MYFLKERAAIRAQAKVKSKHTIKCVAVIVKQTYAPSNALL